MVIDYDSIDKHLELLRNFVAGILKAKKELTPDMVEKDISKQSLIAYPFIQSVQSCLDIGNHIISELNLSRADESAAVFRILAAENIISEEVSKKLIELVKLRNQIVHLYVAVDWEKICSITEEEIEVFNKFQREIVRFLEEEKRRESKK